MSCYVEFIGFGDKSSYCECMLVAKVWLAERSAGLGWRCLGSREGGEG